MAPAYIEDKNGHILPYVRFEGGSLELAPEAKGVLNTLAGGVDPDYESLQPRFEGVMELEGGRVPAVDSEVAVDDKA